MSDYTSKPSKEAVLANSENQDLEEVLPSPPPQDSYVKLAMRNMVRKGRQSLWHFFLTTVGLLGLLVGLAYLTKP